MTLQWRRHSWEERFAPLDSELGSRDPDRTVLVKTVSISTSRELFVHVGLVDNICGSKAGDKLMELYKVRTQR